jgi:hypothetical protein
MNSVPPDTDGDGICDNLDEINDNTPPPDYEFGNITEEPEPPVTERLESDDEPTSDGLPGFTSVLMFTAIAGAMMHLRRRRNS